MVLNLGLATRESSTTSTSVRHSSTTSAYSAITQSSSTLRSSLEAIASQTTEISKSSTEVKTSTQISTISLGSSTEANMRTSRNQNSLPITETRSSREGSIESSALTTLLFTDEQMGSTMTRPFVELLDSSTATQSSSAQTEAGTGESRPKSGSSAEISATTSSSSALLPSAPFDHSSTKGITFNLISHQFLSSIFRRKLRYLCSDL